MNRLAVEVSLRGNRNVVMQLLTPSQLVNAAKLARGSGPMQVGQEAAKLSIVEVDGETVTYTQLQAGKWKQLFPRTRDQLALVKAFNQVHSPTPAAQAAFIKGLEVELGPDGERWTGKLPSGKVVVMVEPPLETVDDVLQSAVIGSRNAAAQQLLLAQESARKSLVSVDGEPVTAADLRGDAWDERFSVVDTLLMGKMWEEAFDTGVEDYSVGEVKPATGT